MNRQVKVIDRSGWDTPGLGQYPATPIIELEWICPVCGGPRGDPWTHPFYENDQALFCHRWTNPCGHVDYYDNVLEEYRQRHPQDQPA